MIGYDRIYVVSGDTLFTGHNILKVNPLMNLPSYAASVCFSLFIVAACTPQALGQSTERQQASTPSQNQSPASDQKIRALIIDGQNNHSAWPKSTLMMRDYLVESGLFTVDIKRTKYTWRGGQAKEFPLNDGKTYEDLKNPKPDPDFAPDFSQYDVVVSNFGYKAAAWPEATQAAFVDYMKNGGGFVTVHAADNSFPKWKEYNLMIGIGGWDGRDNRDNYLYMDDNGEVVIDDSKGRGGNHGPQSEFSLVVRNTTHPITKGLPAEFMHAKDELYNSLRGPAENVTILATAHSTGKRATNRHEPMLMVIDYGKGRVFHSTLGHEDYSFECVGFQTTFLRGTEWAATGKVTIPIPKDFPTPDKSSVRKWQPSTAPATK